MSNWQIIQDEEKISFIAPSGYRFEYSDAGEILLQLNDLLHPGAEFTTRHAERLRVDGWGGWILAINPDPWVNKSFSTGDPVAEAVGFGQVLIKYIGAQLGYPY